MQQGTFEKLLNPCSKCIVPVTRLQFNTRRKISAADALFRAHGRYGRGIACKYPFKNPGTSKYLIIATKKATTCSEESRTEIDIDIMLDDSLLNMVDKCATVTKQTTVYTNYEKSVPYTHSFRGGSQSREYVSQYVVILTFVKQERTKKRCANY